MSRRRRSRPAANVDAAALKGEASPRSTDRSARAAWHAAWPGLLLATALLLPFLGKAHAVDDVTFLLQGKHVLHDPWHPTAFEMVADGARVRVSSWLVTGPLMAWLLVPCVMLGGAEWVAHLMQWLFVCVTVVCSARLSLRFGLSRAAARVAGLLVASCPAVVGMATTSMSDVPAMAFAALGMERFCAWTDEGRPLQGAMAALALACAGLARSHALALPFVAALVIRREAAAPGARHIGVVALPLVASLAVAYAVIHATADSAAARGSVLDAMLARGPSQRWRQNVAGFGCHWLAAVPLTLPWLWARVRHLVRDIGAWLVLVAAGALLVRWGSPKMHPPLAVAAALAYVALVDIHRDAWQRGDRNQLFLGVWLVPALLTAVYAQLPCKFLLISVPAAALLIAGILDRGDHRLPAAVAGAVVAAGAALGVLIVLADQEFTDAGRRAAREFVAPRVAAGERVRFYGAWGAQWYATQAGAEVVARSDPAPVRGDILVASVATPGAGFRGIQVVEPIGELRVNSHFGRVMSARDDVGFYSNVVGYLPWTWRNDFIERVVVFRVP